MDYETERQRVEDCLAATRADIALSLGCADADRRNPVSGSGVSQNVTPERCSTQCSPLPIPPTPAKYENVYGQAQWQNLGPVAQQAAAILDADISAILGNQRDSRYQNLSQWLAGNGK